jgi:hypothetical protein
VGGISSWQYQSEERSKTVVWVRASIIATLALGGLLVMLAFHFVAGDGDFFIIPKDHLTFADTFTTVGSVIDRYNNANLFERLSDTAVSPQRYCQMLCIRSSASASSDQAA